MNENAYPIDRSRQPNQLNQKVPVLNGQLKQSQNGRVAVVTTDRSQWARTADKAKFRWIFWLAVLLSAAILLGSCKNNGSSESAVNPSDTAGLAAFNAQKTADSLSAVENGENAGQNVSQNVGQNVGQNAPANADHTSGIDAGNVSENDENEGTGQIKSVNDNYNNGDDVDDGRYADNGSGGAAPTEEASNREAVPAKKKKFNDASKGAVIGAGSGAVLGAIISKKNRGLGAVIGAAVGGGAGYGIGKHKDNKKAKQGE